MNSAASYYRRRPPNSRQISFIAVMFFKEIVNANQYDFCILHNLLKFRILVLLLYQCFWGFSYLYPLLCVENAEVPQALPPFVGPWES